MREHRTGHHRLLMFQHVNKAVDFIPIPLGGGLGVGSESQPMHTCIQLDMDGITRDTFLAGGLDERIQQAERINLRFQFIVEHRLEGSHLWIHDHDVLRDASFAEGYALVGHGHGQVVHPMVLQRLGHFHGSCAIGIGLHHTDNLRLWMHIGTVVVQVIHQRIEVHLQNRFVHLLFEQFGQTVKTKGTCTLQQDQFVAESAKDTAVDKVLTVVEEVFLKNVDLLSLCRYFRSDADEFLHAALLAECRHLFI